MNHKRGALTGVEPSALFYRPVALPACAASAVATVISRLRRLKLHSTAILQRLLLCIAIHRKRTTAAVNASNERSRRKICPRFTACIAAASLHPRARRPRVSQIYGNGCGRAKWTDIEQAQRVNGAKYDQHGHPVALLDWN